MPRRILFTICLVLGLLPNYSVEAGSQRTPSLDAAELKTRMFDLAQQHHVAAGCESWARDARLDLAAQLHAEEIARRKRVSHVGANGSRVRDRARRQGYPANRATESIALYKTPEASVKFWMSEPPNGPHRRNITWCQYTDAGVGVAYDNRGIAWWVMDYANQAPK